MAISLPNGAVVAIASGYIAAVPITAISNASAAVVTAANTLAVGDFVEITSGWSKLTNKIFRVASPTASTFVLEGADTTSVTNFPAGGGIGSFRKISGWTQMSQILTSQSSGGDQQFVNYQFLESDAESRIPTIKAAAGLSFSVADDPTLAGYQLAAIANDDRLPRAVRISLPNGSIILYDAYVSLNRTPSLSVNTIMAVEVTLSLLTPIPVRY